MSEINISGIGSGNLLSWGSGITLDDLIKGKGADAITFIVGFSALVAVILLVYSGYLFITSAGDPDKVETAQKTLTAAIIGMIVIFLANLIVRFVLENVL